MCPKTSVVLINRGKKETRNKKNRTQEKILMPYLQLAVYKFQFHFLNTVKYIP